MENPMISVIIPVWGVEKYIAKCAKSLFESTIENIEFIFVDDCSPDKSVEVLKRIMNEYPKRKMQSVIIRHEKNMGLPQARKTGYEHSKGEWVIYCDSDDTVDREMYSKMYDKAVKDKCDIVLCDLIVHSNEKVLWRHSYKGDDSEKIRMGLLEGSISNSLCTKMVKRDIFKKNDIFFPSHMVDEDDVITSQLAYYACKIGYVHEPLYLVYANPNSMTRKNSKEKAIANLTDQIENRKWIIGFLDSRDDDNLSNAIFCYKKSVKMLMCRRGDKPKAIRKLYNEINFKMLFGRGMTIRERVLCFSIFYLPFIYTAYKNTK